MDTTNSCWVSCFKISQVFIRQLRDHIKALKLRPQQLLRRHNRRALQRGSRQAELCTVLYCGSSTAAPQLDCSAEQHVKKSASVDEQI